METLKEFSNSIQERLRNPFLFAFALSWFFWNWVAIYGLLFYSLAEVNALGFDTHGVYFDACTNADTLLNYPIACAIIYVLINPVLIAVIELYRTNIEAKKSIRKEKYEGRAFIPYVRYLVMVKNLKEQEDEFANFTQKERYIYERECEEHRETQQKLINVKLELENAKELSVDAASDRGYAILKGRWRLHYPKGPHHPIYWEISGEAIYESSDTEAPIKIGKLEDVLCPKDSNKILFYVAFTEGHKTRPYRSYLTNCGFYLDESKTALRMTGAIKPEITLSKVVASIADTA